MNFFKLFSFLYILRDGGQGCFQLIGLCFLAIIIVLSIKFIYVHFIMVFLTCLIVIATLEGVKLIKNHFIYKDETPEQRAERLKTEEMIKEWQKRYY